MPLSISPSVIDWKAVDDQKIPYAVLFEIPVNATTTHRLVQGDPLGTGQVVFGSQTYLAAAIQLEDSAQQIDGTLSTHRLSISNIDGVAGGYMEREDLEGQIVTMIHVVCLPAGPVEVARIEAEIQDQAYNRKAATVTLGPPNLFRIKRPWQTRQRHTCQFDFADRFRVGSLCGYPSDEFGPDKAQDLRSGAAANAVAQKRQHGWWTLNAKKASEINVDLSLPDHLYLRSVDPDMEWGPQVYESPFVFKKLTGDFDANCRVASIDTRQGSLAGILCSGDAGSADTWVQLGRGQRQDGTEYLRLALSVSGAPAADNNSADVAAEYLRLRRVGNVFTFFYSLDGIAWTELAQKTVPMDASMRLGLAISSPSVESQPVTAAFDFFRFTAGGDAACTLGFSACTAKGNSARFGANPGIPSR